MIAPGYQLWNTVSTKADIYLPVGNSNKNTKINVKLTVVLLVYFFVNLEYLSHPI